MGWGWEGPSGKDHKITFYPLQLKSFKGKFSSSFCLLLFTCQCLQIVAFWFTFCLDFIVVNFVIFYRGIKA